VCGNGKNLKVLCLGFVAGKAITKKEVNMARLFVRAQQQHVLDVEENETVKQLRVRFMSKR